jgi:hypothetical protein
MPRIKLKANTHFTVPFDLPRSRRTVDFFVEADLPVRTFILDDDELAAFRAGKRYKTYGADRAKKRHEKRVRIPSGAWNFVIVNSNDEPVSVFYELT